LMKKKGFEWKNNFAFVCVCESFYPINLLANSQLHGHAWTKDRPQMWATKFLAWYEKIFKALGLAHGKQNKFIYIWKTLPRQLTFFNMFHVVGNIIIFLSIKGSASGIVGDAHNKFSLKHFRENFIKLNVNLNIGHLHFSIFNLNRSTCPADE
jgi:hypothetical protein